MNYKEINDLAVKIHENNKVVGWWPKGRNIVSVFQLINTEISEASEGARKNINDTHLTNRKMEEVELADTVIRLLDYAGYKGLELHSDFTVGLPLYSHLDNPENRLEQHFYMSKLVVDLYEISESGSMVKNVANKKYADLLSLILSYATACGYDLWDALFEKMEYNKHRADHKKEAREAEGGKKC